MSYSVIVVPHPLKPNKRVRVEVPDNVSAKDAKNAIEWSLLANTAVLHLANNNTSDMTSTNQSWKTIRRRTVRRWAGGPGKLAKFDGANTRLWRA